MRCDTLYHHVAAENHIVQPDGNVTGAMPGQMDKLKWTKLHIHGFKGEIHGDGLIDGLTKSVHAEDLLTGLFGKPGLGQEGCEAPPNQRQPGFMMRDRLHVEFMASDPCIC